MYQVLSVLFELYSFNLVVVIMAMADKNEESSLVNL